MAVNKKNNFYRKKIRYNFLRYVTLGYYDDTFSVGMQKKSKSQKKCLNVYCNLKLFNILLWDIILLTEERRKEALILRKEQSQTYDI